MTFTYNLVALTTPTHADHELVRIRLALGDTVEKYKHLEDEEIRFLRSQNPTSIDATVVACAEMIAMRYAHEATHSVGDARYDLDTRAGRWRSLANGLRLRMQKKAAASPEPMLPSRRPYFYEDMTHPTYWDDFLERLHER